jgi:CMP-N,N'-diacetyllegionaminic acid synthase
MPEKNSSADGEITGNFNPVDMKKMPKNLKILAVIPARGGSKGIPGKNVRLFNGRPLINYAILLAKQAEKKGLIAGHIVSTDDKRIGLLAKKLGGNVPFLRPKKFAGADSLTVDVVIHAVKWWEKIHNDKIHSTLLLQPTNPLTTIEDIDNALKTYRKNQPKARCLISICDSQHVRPQTLYYKRGKYLKQLIKGANPLIRRQATPNIYWRNGAIYLTRRDLLFGERKIIDDRPIFYEMPRFRSIAIDDMFDWTIAEFLKSYQQKEAYR